MPLIQHPGVSFTSDLSVEVEEQHDDQHIHPDPLTVPRAHASSCVKNPAQSQHAERFKTTDRCYWNYSPKRRQSR